MEKPNDITSEILSDIFAHILYEPEAPEDVDFCLKFNNTHKISIIHHQ